MNITDQLGILRFFSDYIIKEIYRNNKDIILVFVPNYENLNFTLVKCVLINCKEFVLNLSSGASLTDLNEINRYEVTFNWSERKNDGIFIDCLLNQTKKSNLVIKTESIKVLDELDNEISLLDFAVMNGLCDSGIGIDFVSMNNLESNYPDRKSVKFNEELITYLSWEEVKEPIIESKLLMGLDEYGEKQFTVEEISELIRICNGFLAKYYSEGFYHQNIRFFASKLKQLCQETLSENKILIARGD